MSRIVVNNQFLSNLRQVSRNDQLLSGPVISGSDSMSSAGAACTVRHSLEITDQMKRLESDAVARDDLQSPVLQHYRKASNGSNKIFATHSRNSSLDKRASNLMISHHSREPSTISTGDSACADLDTSHLQSPLQPRLPSMKVNELFQATNISPSTSSTLVIYTFILYLYLLVQLCVCLQLPYCRCSFFELQFIIFLLIHVLTLGVNVYYSLYFCLT